MLCYFLQAKMTSEQEDSNSHYNIEMNVVSTPQSATPQDSMQQTDSPQVDKEDALHEVGGKRKLMSQW